MNKKKTITLTLSSLAVIAACVAIVAFIRSTTAGNPTIDVSNAGLSNATPTSAVQTVENTIGQTVSEVVAQVSETVSAVASTTAPSTAQKAQTEIASTTKKEETTTRKFEDAVKEEELDVGQAKPPAATSSGTLPKDMSFAGLYNSGYDVIGNKKYIFNNDKTAAQAKFGYNRFYDRAASLVDMYIETVRIQFNGYDGRDWMIQLWKGQYISGDIGTVGCEIGLYNRKAGTISAIGHYSCAKEADWLNMEMTLYWDENRSGNFTPQFTRNYTAYWWPTGFVDGQLANARDSSELYILGRITFKDTDMADLFEAAMSKVGFTKVSSFSPYVLDTYKRYGCDVIFTWNNVRN